MNPRKKLSLALLACCPVLPAQAADFLSSSYIEAAHLNSSVDAGGATENEVEGFRVAASVGLLPYLNFVADYDRRRYEDAQDGFASVGLAGHTTNPVWQVFIAATYERADFNGSTSAEDHEEEGYGIEGGARAVAPFLELHASYKYFDLGKAGPTTELTGARYGGGIALDLTSWWSLTGDYRIRTHELEDAGANPVTTTETEFTEWTVGLRRYFATQTDRRNRKGGLFGALFGADDGA